jgi:type I restriction enzyme M protein
MLDEMTLQYAISRQELEAERAQTLGELNEFLVKLGYVS